MTGTVSAVSPRPRNDVPAQHKARLVLLASQRSDLDEDMRTAVLAALDAGGSVRRVADTEIPIYNILVDNLRAKLKTSQPTKKKTALVPGFEHLGVRMKSPDFKPVAVLASKKYKPVALKVKPLLGDLPDKFRIVRDIKGDPLKDIPLLSTSLPEYVPTARYTPERKAKIDENHPEGFLWPEERKLMHHFMTIQE